jgi:hypothetical protein
VNPPEILAVAVLATVYVAFCVYWWRGGHPLTRRDEPPRRNDDG